MNVDDLLEQLNTYQRKAVLDNSQACLVNAQVGSGKTTVLTTKVIMLHEQIKVPYENMVVLTFTNKAAEEIKTRVRGIDVTISKDSLVYFGTFHSLALTLLKSVLPIQDIGYTADFSVMDPDEELDMADRIIDSNGLNIKYRNKISSRLEKLQHGSVKYGTMKYDDDILRLSELLRDERKRCGKMNFDDLIHYATLLLPSVSFRPQWIIIDEFQDTNEAQMTFIDSLIGNDTHIFAVGDPNQVIYTWRGSNSNLFFEFTKKYNAVEYSLPINYRSCSTILDVARCFIKDPTGLSGIREAGNRIKVVKHYDAFNEANYLVDRVKELTASGANYKDIAIFYRMQKQSEILEKTFGREGIPYKVSVRKTLKDFPVLRWFVSLLRFSVNSADIDSAIGILSDQQYGMGYSKSEADRIVHSNLSENKSQNIQILQKCIELKSWCEIGNSLSQLGQYFDINSLIHPNSSTYTQDKAAIDLLVSKIESYSRSNGLSMFDGIASFISSSALFGMSILDNDEASADDAVSLMTLHAAKGLEFKYVYLIGVNDGYIPLRSSKTDEEEERRLFFVGLTRAKDSVEISYYINPDDPRVFGGPSQYIRMIPDNLLDMEEVLDGGIALQDLRRAIMGNHEEDYYGTPPEEYEYLPPPDDYDFVPPEINETKKAKHAKYGIGVVTSETEDMITVLFDGYGEKTFLKAFGEIEIL